ncbi:SLAC1 anion channel family protein [Yoonia sp. I 8.24]|uniref:SLAC1 anion channel family protein n=1 Tax=Yoonia sp. I 8.24 TaxID=1537229 RepID=UPI00351CF8FB
MSVPTPSHDSPNRLENYPITLFAIGMGMMGLTLALHAAETSYGAGHGISTVMLAVSIAMLAAIAGGYTAKAIWHPQKVAEEWRHPVKIAFFPAVSISFLLLSTALVDLAPGIAKPLWILATALQGILALWVIAAWIGHRPFKPAMMTPAWFIPAVGNVIVPLAGVRLGYVESSWLFFSGGLVFWVVLLTLVMNRLMFHDPMPGKMVPTLMILVAPPAVAFSAWMQLNGGAVGPFGHFLLSAAYVFALLVVTQVSKLREPAVRPVMVGAFVPDCRACNCQLWLCARG